MSCVCMGKHSNLTPACQSTYTYLPSQGEEAAAVAGSVVSRPWESEHGQLLEEVRVCVHAFMCMCVWCVSVREREAE